MTGTKPALPEGATHATAAKICNSSLWPYGRTMFFNLARKGHLTRIKPNGAGRPIYEIAEVRAYLSNNQA